MMAKNQKEKKLGEILIEKGWIRSDQVEIALLEQKTTKEFLGSILLRKKYVTEQHLTIALSTQFGIPCATIRGIPIDGELVNRFSTALISEHRCFPIDQDDRHVTFAITNPLDAWAMGKAGEEAKGKNVQFILVPESEMAEVLDRYREQVNMRIRKMLDEGKS